MKFRLALLASLLCVPGAATAGPAADGVLGAATVGPPIAVGNLVVYPLIAKTRQAGGNYDTLDVALKDKRLVVLEKGSDGQVSELHVDNRGQKPIFALAGELLLGGKQDRIVAQSTIIPKGAKRFAVPVFCVEHGRWAKQTAQFSSGKKLAHTKLRQSAKGQSQVWAEVAATNDRRGTKNSTDTYRSAVTDSARNRRVAAMVRTISQSTAKEPAIAGIAVAINGKARAFDWFADTDLYRRLEAKLLDSYANEAVDVASAGPPPPAPKVKAVEMFLDDAKKARSVGRKKSGAAASVQFDAADIEGTATTPEGEAEPVHMNYFSK